MTSRQLDAGSAAGTDYENLGIEDRGKLSTSFQGKMIWLKPD